LEGQKIWVNSNPHPVDKIELPC
ncbi:hypothetical protein HKBW3C_02797, partial [Candidatus Hakubella thermalkaliphila]